MKWSHWVQGSRPKTLTASAAPIFVATALARHESYPTDWALVIFAFFAAVLIQIGTNFFNDVLDFRKGADTHERIGPQRLSLSGEASEGKVFRAGVLCFALATLFGIPLVMAGGWPIVIVGVLSLFFGYTYTGGPFPLAYRGLGDIFVILFFGVVAVCGLYFILTQTVTVDAFVAGVQIGFFATTLIAINNYRDFVQDRKAKKWTLAARFGPEFARNEILILFLSPFLALSYWYQSGRWLAACLPLILLPLTLKLVKSLWFEMPGPQFNTYLAKAGGLHLGFGVLLGLGLVLT